MTKNAENRNRVQAGIPTGGQFAPEQHSEPAGVTLTALSPLDSRALGVVAHLVRSRSNIEIGSWQRRMDKGGGHLRPQPPMPDVLVELDRRAKAFETLPREEQDAILDQLQMPGTKHFLDPGQRIGNDKVQVAENVEAQAENLGLALAAQKIVADANLPGTVTMTKAGIHETVFTVEVAGESHNLRVGAHSSTITTRSDDPVLDDWLQRGITNSSGSHVFDPRTSERIQRDFGAHREYAALMTAVAASSFREAFVNLGELNRKTRTAELRTDGVHYIVDVSGEKPALETEEGEQLHPSMVSGFLNHMAEQTGHSDGDALASDLREVFREADRRLIP